MKAPDFDKLFYEIGRGYLEKSGFVFKNTGWHKLTEEFQLSYIFIRDTNLAAYSARTLTLAFDRFSSPIGEGQSRVVLETPDLVSPIQMNPSLLKEYVKSGYDDEIWHHSKINGAITSKLSYCKLYYGGRKPRSLISMLKNTRSGFEKRLNDINIDYISEKETINRLKEYAENVAGYGYDFCMHMQSKELIRQIRKYGSDLPVEVMWVNRYERAAVKNI